MVEQNTLDIYIEAAKRHGEATESGNYRNANKQYAKAIAAYKKMLKANDHSFESLLSHPDSSVRGWAAVHSLPFIPDKARSVLAEIAEGKGLIAFNATITLKEYDRGTLKIDGYHFNTD